LAAGGLALPLGGGAPASAATSATNQPPGLDHFLCYNAVTVAGSVPAFVVPPKVHLLNQFSPKPFTPVFGAVDQHCNPALKIVTLPPGPQQYPPKSPSWHLLCYRIQGKQSPNTHVVQVTDQFGTAMLQTGPPIQFCLPSLKSLASPPVFKKPAPGEVKPDHFTCYPVAYVPGTPPLVPPGPVAVSDQFNTGGPVQVQIGSPTQLCVPTQKTIGKKVTPVTNPAAHLLCFAVSQTPLRSPLWDKNQFGVGEVSIQNTATLCLPTFKTLIK
jgi:hypothetical protein